MSNKVDRPQTSNCRATVQFRDVCGKCGARRIDAQLGLEPTPADFVAKMVQVFREVWRVLRNDGCAWVNLGDSYAGGGPHHGEKNPGKSRTNRGSITGIDRPSVPGLKPKDLCMIPHRVAIALQADGWWLRDAIVWAKGEVDEDSVLTGSPMPGSQRDRCTSAHEMLFQLAKAPRYYFDPEAEKTQSGAMLRNVWRINPEPTKIKHFATYPRELVRRCIRLSTSERGCCPTCGAPWARVTESERVATRPGRDTKINGRQASEIGNRDPGRHVTTTQTTGWRPTCEHGHAPVPAIVFDPFVGSGTTGVVALALGRQFIGCDLSRDYLAMADRRISRPHAPIVRAGKAEHHPLFAGQE